MQPACTIFTLLAVQSYNPESFAETFMTLKCLAAERTFPSFFREQDNSPLDNCHLGQLPPEYSPHRQFPPRAIAPQTITPRTVAPCTIPTLENFPQIIAPGQFPPSIIFSPNYIGFGITMYIALNSYIFLVLNHYELFRNNRTVKI